jgi:DNA-directed RNA polymerase specialized sigma24 family protein
MRSQRARIVSDTFCLHSIDRMGRTIDPLVLSVAHELGPRAANYAERLLGDHALAIDLLEESAAAVSQALKRKTSGDSCPVRDLAGYLFRTYLRKVNYIRGRQTRLDRSLRDRAYTESSATETTWAETSVLFDEVMATYDKVTRQIVCLHLEGFSWDEIGAEFSLKPHTAEVRYSRALAKARKVFAPKWRSQG